MKALRLGLLIYSVALVASAQVFNVLHHFTANDSQPNGLTLIGNVLYGTSQNSVFTLNPDGTGYKVLYNFGGAQPLSPVVVQGSAVYGTTFKGGSNLLGTIFEALPTAIITLHSFTGATDGQWPNGGLILSGKTFYGTTSAGGAFSNGALFSINTDGSGFQVLHSFGSSSTDGTAANGGLLLISNSLFGTTQSGGSFGGGTVFSYVSTPGLPSVYSVLHSFSNSEGLGPYAGVTVLGDLLYGTTTSGGPAGFGTLFVLNQDGSVFSVLGNLPAGAAFPAITPLSEPSLIPTANSLYGATISSGISNAGAIYSVSPNGSSFDVLHGFTGGVDGRWPSGGLVEMSNVLYGTTLRGGSNDFGTVYSLIVPGIRFDFQPTAQAAVGIGSSAGFGAGATSFATNHPNVVYQWRRNGVNIPTATSSSLLIPAVQTADYGAITVVAGDGVAADSSGVAALTPNLPGAFGGGSFSKRFQLRGAASGSVRSSNSNSVSETGEPQILPTADGGHPAWFGWTPPTNGVVTFNTAGSGFDTILGAYEGTTLANLSPAPGVINDDDAGGYLTSKITFSVTASNQYQIVVDGHSGSVGDIVLSWDLQETSNTLPIIKLAPPPYTVVSNGQTVIFNCKAAASQIAWFFNGQPTGVQGSSFGIASASLSNVGFYVASASNSAGVVTTEPAFLQVGTDENGATLANSVVFSKFQDAVNASITGNVPRPFLPKGGGDTRGYSVSQTFSTVGYMGEPDEPAICGQIGGAPGWYIYQTPAAGSLMVSTAGSGFNTMIGVYIGPKGSSATLDTLTNLGCDYTTNYVLNGQPQVFIPGMPSNLVTFIGVDGYQGATGQVALKISLGNPLTIASPLANLTVPAGSDAIFSITATGSTPKSYSWKYNGSPISGATNSTFTVTKAQATNAGTYSVAVSNLLSVVSSSGTLSVLPPPPAITSAIGSGSSISISGTNGVKNGTFYVLSSTNITAPMASWTVVLTNTFNGSGNFSFLLPISPNMMTFFTIKE